MKYGLTDSLYADMSAIDCGHTLAQIYFGSNSHVTAFYGIKSTMNFLQTLQDFVRKWGTPNRIITDHANYETSGRVLDYLRMLWIGLWYSEAKHQHQDKLERRFQTLKMMTLYDGSYSSQSQPMPSFRSDDAWDNNNIPFGVHLHDPSIMVPFQL